MGPTKDCSTVVDIHLKTFVNSRFLCNILYMKVLVRDKTDIYTYIYIYIYIYIYMYIYMHSVIIDNARLELFTV